MDDSPLASLKQCTKCEQVFPLTSDFFQPNKSKKGGFESHCKECQRARNKQRYEQNKAQVHEQQRVYRETHREQILEGKKQYYEAHKDEDNARRKAYHQDHLEQEREHKRQHYHAHVDEMRVRSSQYRDAHKAEIAASKQAYQQGETHKSYQKRYQQEHKDVLSQQNRQRYLAHQEERTERQRQYLQSERGRMVDKAHKWKRKAQKRASEGHYTSQQLQDQFSRQKSKCYYCKVKLGKIWHPDHIVPLAKGGSNDIHNIVIACPTCNLRKHARLPHEWPEGGRLL